MTTPPPPSRARGSASTSATPPRQRAGSALNPRTAVLRFGIPSKGRIEEQTTQFLREVGLPISRPNPRQYVGRVGSLPGVTAVFQRSSDIVAKVDEGSLDIGITGFDAVCEYRYDDDNLIILMEDLGYSRIQVVVAVPDSWLDITTMADLADLAVEFKSAGRELRIATDFPNLASRFLHSHGVHYFALTGAHGALEAAPSMGYADLVIEITETGTTLRDNRLKLLEGGSIMRSQACLLGHRRLLAASHEKRHLLRQIMELIEARLRARSFRRITANVRGESPEAVARQVVSQIEIAGSQGPTIAPVFPKQASLGERWFAVTVIVPADLLLKAVDHLRHIGGSGISVQTPEYLFEAESWHYRAVLRQLEEGA